MSAMRDDNSITGSDYVNNNIKEWTRSIKFGGEMINDYTVTAQISLYVTLSERNEHFSKKHSANVRQKR